MNRSKVYIEQFNKAELEKLLVFNHSPFAGYAQNNT